MCDIRSDPVRGRDTDCGLWDRLRRVSHDSRSDTLRWALHTVARRRGPPHEHGGEYAARLGLRIASQPIRRNVQWFHTLFLVLSGLFLLACGGSTVSVPAGGPTPFDNVVWRNAKTASDPARLHMIDDLVRQHALVGMSVADVESLLGRADYTDDVHLDGRLWHAYYLGGVKYRDALGTETINATLNLESDGNGRIASYLLVPRRAFPGHR